MSAQLAGDGQRPSHFNAFLQLPGGASAHLQAPTLTALTEIVAKLQAPANDPMAGKSVAQVTPVPTAAPAATGNAPASTATQASAPAAASGSAASDEAKTITYNEIRDRVLALSKVSRDTAVGALKHFGVDHGNKLPLEQYAAFMAHTDGLLPAKA